MASEPVECGKSFAAFIPELDRLVAEVMEEWKIPGLAVAVVQDGDVALAKPHGFRDLEAGLPVTTDTQFQTHVGLEVVRRHRLGSLGGRAAHGLEEAGTRIHPGIPAT